MSLAEPQRTQRRTSFLWATPKKMNNTDFNALCLISLSEIKSLCVSVSSSEAGEIKKECLTQSRRDHREKKTVCLVAFAQKGNNYSTFAAGQLFNYFRLCVSVWVCGQNYMNRWFKLNEYKRCLLIGAFLFFNRFFVLNTYPDQEDGD